MLTNPKDGLGKIITWGNPVALEGYIQRLQSVANGLTDKNRRLRKWHRVLGEKARCHSALNTDRTTITSVSLHKTHSYVRIRAETIPSRLNAKNCPPRRLLISCRRCRANRKGADWWLTRRDTVVCIHRDCAIPWRAQS